MSKAIVKNYDNTDLMQSHALRQCFEKQIAGKMDFFYYGFQSDFYSTTRF